MTDITVFPPRDQCSPATREDILRLRAQGFGIKKICAELKLGYIRYRTLMYDVPVQSRFRGPAVIKPKPKPANLTPRPYYTGLLWGGPRRGGHNSD